MWSVQLSRALTQDCAAQQRAYPAAMTPEFHPCTFQKQRKFKMSQVRPFDCLTVCLK